MRNTKGFTLVELLAVIVILAVVMLMAVTAVGPLMSKSRKGSLGSEGLELVKAAKTAFQLEQMKASSAVNSTSSVCFSLNWLNNNDFFEKGSGQGYTGSVLVTYANGNYTYSFWISNGTYAFEGVKEQEYDYEKAKDQGSAAEDCGAAAGVVKCTASGSDKGSCAK